MTHLLAFDIGTTGNKACLVSDAGRVVATATVPYPSHYPKPGWAEQDPRDWWAAVCQSSRQLLDQTDINPGDIAAVGFSGHMMGCLSVDEDGAPLGRAWLHSDTRAEDECRQLEERIGFDRFYEITGNRLDPHYPLAKWMAFRNQNPDLFARTACFLQSKDWIAGRFIGDFGHTDYSDASLTCALDVTSGEWSDELLAAADILRDLMPRVVSSATVIGTITPEAAGETGLHSGTPVVMGGGDGSCAAVGAGAVASGSAYVNVGSTAWLSIIGNQPLLDPEARSFVLIGLDGKQRQALGTVQGAGNVYRWLHGILNTGANDANKPELTFEQINNEAAASPPGANGLLFLPYLEGERTPIWDPRARGGWIGLGIGHNRGDLARAVLEGIALALRHVREVVDPDHNLSHLTAIGGMVQGEVFRKVLASVVNCPIAVPANAGEATSVGAALAAGVGARVWADYGEAVAALEMGVTTEPDPDWVDIYNQAFPKYVALYPALRHIMHGLG